MNKSLMVLSAAILALALACCWLAWEQRRLSDGRRIARGIEEHFAERDREAEMQAVAARRAVFDRADALEKAR